MCIGVKGKIIDIKEQNRPESNDESNILTKTTNKDTEMHRPESPENTTRRNYGRYSRYIAAFSAGVVGVIGIGFVICKYREESKILQTVLQQNQTVLQQNQMVLQRMLSKD